jgi:tetratricopeptide (TPR) repeat protein
MKRTGRLAIGAGIATVAAVAALFGGVAREGGTGEAAAAGPPAAQQAVRAGGELQERARVTGDPRLYGPAERSFRRALAVEPANAAALRGLAAVAASRHRFAESLELARRARTIEPWVPAVYGLIGDAQLELGRYPAAFDAFDRMVAMKPSASSYARVSYARELRGDLRGAIVAMRLAAGAAPFGEPAAWTRTLLGRLLAADGKRQAAARRFQEALSHQPGYPAALSGLADLAVSRGDLGTARDRLLRASRGSTVPEFWATLGDVSAALGKPAEARRAWAEAARLERLFAANGGRNLLETAEFDLDHDRNLRSALDRARRGRAERPSVEGDHVLAWALYKNGLCAEARTVSLRSFRLGTQDVDGLYHHSLIEACLGNQAAAARYRGQVRSLDPGYLANAPSAWRLSG